MDEKADAIRTLELVCTTQVPGLQLKPLFRHL
jgi:hypothetical protein